VAGVFDVSFFSWKSLDFKKEKKEFLVASVGFLRKMKFFCENGSIYEFCIKISP
jgi:hypothetical protein